MADLETLKPGTVLAERYRIGHQLGHGAMGSVYFAEHVTVGRSVAVKLLAKQWRDDREMVERFRNEARSASAAGHPNIVDVLDAGELEDGTPWLVMEYLAGRTLYDVMQAEGPFDLVRAASIAHDVGRALLAAHREGVIHRDLKAENVMMVERGGETLVKVLDFGVAHVVTLQKRQTSPGSVIGTPEYIAPEAVRAQAPTPALDVYALGVLMHEMLAGEAPFADRDPVRLLEWKLEHTPPSIAELRPDLPRNMVTLVDLCLSRMPEARPTTSEIVETLAGIVEPRGETLSLVPARLPTSRRQRPLVVAIAGGLVGILAAWAIVVEPRGSTVPTDVRDDAAEVPPEPLRETPRAAGVIPPEAPKPQTLGPVLHGEVDPADRGPPEETVVAVDPSPRSAAPGRKEDCSFVVKRAYEARDTHDWEGLLRYSRRSSCFGTEHTHLRVKALMELGRFDDCVTAGHGSNHPAVQKSVKLCRKRLER